MRNVGDPQASTSFASGRERQILRTLARWARGIDHAFEGSNDGPSTRSMRAVAQLSRTLRAFVYSGLDHQSLAACADGNSSTTKRWGLQSPSSVSVVPPRTRYLPLCFAIVGGARSMYSL